MAEIINTSTDYIHDERRAVEHSSFNWRAVFAGAFIALLTYFILTALGLAIGGSSLEGVITGGDGLQSLGIGTAIWLVVSVLIALAVGSYFAARVSGLITSRVGGTQGLVITSLFFAFMMWQVSSGIGMLTSGVGSVFGAVGSAADNIARNPQVQDVVQRSLGDLNLQSPPEEVAQGVAIRLLRGQEEQAKSYLANQAGISEAQADRRLAQFRDQLQSTAQDVGQSVAQVASIAGWTIFGMLLLGSIAALLGGGAGARATLKRPLSRGDVKNIDKTRAA